MPCYHFTFHGYGTWMPDEDDGYVLRGKGHQPQDTTKAAEYRRHMSNDEVEFDDAKQLALIDEAHVASTHQLFRAHFIATEPTHIHILIVGRTNSGRLKRFARRSASRSLVASQRTSVRVSGSARAAAADA